MSWRKSPTRDIISSSCTFVTHDHQYYSAYLNSSFPISTLLTTVNDYNPTVPRVLAHFDNILGFLGTMWCKYPPGFPKLSDGKSTTNTALCMTERKNIAIFYNNVTLHIK